MPRLVLALTIVLAAAPAAAQPSRSLTEEQVACDRERLLALLDRMTLEPGSSELGEGGVVRSVFVTYSNRFGFFEGLVARTEWSDGIALPPAPAPPAHETLLAFHLNPSVRELLLNPARPTLEQVSLTREVSTSNLVPPGDDRTLVLRLDPTLRPEPSSGSGGPGDLVIDNLVSPPPAGLGFRPADTKPGRGLMQAAVTVPCHTRFTQADRRMFALLQRVLRFTVAPGDGGAPFDAPPDVQVALYRGVAPGTFRADVRLVDPVTGARLQPQALRRLEISTVLDGDGEIVGLLLSHGEVPPRPSEAVVVAYLARPIFEDGGPAVAPIDGLALEDLALPFPPMVEVDWRTLLEGTTWSPRTPAAGACGQGTAEEIGATPRADPATELLALSMGEGLTADPTTYDRLVRDLAAIAAFEPAVEGIDIFPTTDARTLIVDAADADVADAIYRGSFHAWDCLNDWYQLLGVGFLEPGILPGTTFVVELEGLYALERVAEDYAAVDGIASAHPLVFPPPGAPAGTLPSLCADEGEDGVFLYFFDVPSPGGPAITYHFTTTAAGDVDLVAVFNPAGVNPLVIPPWLHLADECYAALRYGRRG